MSRAFVIKREDGKYRTIHLQYKLSTNPIVNYDMMFKTKNDAKEYIKSHIYKNKNKYSIVEVEINEVKDDN